MLREHFGTAFDKPRPSGIIGKGAMVDVLTNAINAAALRDLELANDATSCKALLASTLDVEGYGLSDGSSAAVRAGVEVDLYYYAYAFCKERRFEGRKISVVLAVLRELVKFDSQSELSTMEHSFERFQQLCMLHACERPPWTAGVLTLDDIERVVDHVADSYYRHFKLFKSVFTVEERLLLEQQTCFGVETAQTPPALTSMDPADPVDESKVAGGPDGIDEGGAGATTDSGASEVPGDADPATEDGVAGTDGAVEGAAEDDPLSGVEDFADLGEEEKQLILDVVAAEVARQTRILEDRDAAEEAVFQAKLRALEC